MAKTECQGSLIYIVIRYTRRKAMGMDYKFITDLLDTAEVPNEGIHSRVLQKDEHVNITLFRFSAGQELSTHSAPTPAVICILSGEADITLGEDVHHAKAGSFAYMPPLFPHAIAAKMQRLCSSSRSRCRRNSG